jgi:NhaP-type Na+/H+ or K+/H+ antiporter
VIDGESLMNDGSALVIFLLLQKIVEGEAVTVGGVSIDLLLLRVSGHSGESSKVPGGAGCECQ